MSNQLFLDPRINPTTCIRNDIGWILMIFLLIKNITVSICYPLAYIFFYMFPLESASKIKIKIKKAYIGRPSVDGYGAIIGYTIFCFSFLIFPVTNFVPIYTLYIVRFTVLIFIVLFTMFRPLNDPAFFKWYTLKFVT